MGAESTGAVQIRCECGNWIHGQASDGIVRCECGAKYVVTITELSAEANH